MGVTIVVDAQNHLLDVTPLMRDSKKRDEVLKAAKLAYPDLDDNSAFARYIQEKVAKEMGLNFRTSPESK